MRSSMTLLVGLVLIGAGCEKRVYELELTPDKDQLKRQLTGHIDSDGQGAPQIKPLGEEELTRIAAQYGTRRPQGGGPKHSFEGSFLGRMPQDIGGHGTYQQWTSEFGTARLYIERFRGNDDFVGTMDKCRESISRVIELLVVWVDDTWANQPEHAALRRFVDRDLRRDLENIACYLKAAELHGSSRDVSDDNPAERIQRDAGDIVARIPQYLVERQYIDLAQLPRLTRALQESDEAAGRPMLMQLLQDAVRRKIGIAADEPLPPGLTPFADQTRLLKSLNDSLRKSDEYRAKLAAWEQTPVNERSELPEEPVSVIGDILGQGFGMEFLFGRPDELNATLHAATKPFSTNGTWDDKRKAVVWKKRLTTDQSNSIAPEIAYAVWTDANSNAQEKLLGSVSLRDENLFGYCMWRNALTPDELRQWSKFIADTTSTDTFAQRLEGFRFEGEPEEEDSASRSGTVRQLLLQSGK